MKRFFDFAVAFLLLVALSPAMLLLAVLVFMNLGAPVFFKQQRPGLHGRSFYIYKFRSMTGKRNTEEELLSDAERLTPFGRFLRRYSLDELPQLYNVLKGDLSLVGPRALLMEYLPLYSPEQARRHEMKPGITGWAQINGRNAIIWEEKFRYDVWYVDHQSFWLDMNILYRTVFMVCKGHGINEDGHATASPFKGVKGDL